MWQISIVTEFLSSTFSLFLRIRPSIHWDLGLYLIFRFDVVILLHIMMLKSVSLSLLCMTLLNVRLLCVSRFVTLFFSLSSKISEYHQRGQKHTSRSWYIILHDHVPKIRKFHDHIKAKRPFTFHKIEAWAPSAECWVTYCGNHGPILIKGIYTLWHSLSFSNKIPCILWHTKKNLPLSRLLRRNVKSVFGTVMTSDVKLRSSLCSTPLCTLSSEKQSHWLRLVVII